MSVSSEYVMNNGASLCVKTLRGVCGHGPKRDLTFDRLNYKTIGNLLVRKRLVESVFEWRPILAKQLVQITTQEPHFVVA